MIYAVYIQVKIGPSQFLYIKRQWISVNNLTVSYILVSDYSLLITIFKHFYSSSTLSNARFNMTKQSGCSNPLPVTLVFANIQLAFGYWRDWLLGESKALIKYIQSYYYTQNIMLVLKSWARFSTQIGQQQNNMKRFYKQATFTINPKKKHPFHNYLITLDGKTITTPYRNVLAVPSTALAFLVSNQFNRQNKYLKTGQMPMLSLCRTAVDADIEGHLAEHLQSSIFQYLKTDTLLFHDESFINQHQQFSMPLVKNFMDYFKMKIEPSGTLETPICEINQNFVNWVKGLNNWQLIGMQTMTIWMKSTIGAFSIIQSNANPQDIQKAAYLQQITQMKRNGQVQQRIMDINQIRLMISCGEMIYRYSRDDASQ